MTKCLHDLSTVDFALNVQHFGNTNIKYLEITGACRACGSRMIFRGPNGVSPDCPTVSAIDGTEVTNPFLFEDERYDGKGVGFSVSMSGSN